MKKSHQKHLAKGQIAIAEKKECTREGNCQINNVVRKCDVTKPLLKKVYLGLAEGEWSAVSITTRYHLNTRDILTRQHFQVTCGTWIVFQVKHLT